MGLLLDLQRRIPDRWYFRRLIPASVFVAVAVVCGGRLGQAHWHDLRLAREQIAYYLGAGGGKPSATAAALLVYAAFVAMTAFALPIAAQAIAVLVGGAWPWWLASLGERRRRARARRWRSPEDLLKLAVRARPGRHETRAARLEARAVAALPIEPCTPTWTGDRLALAVANVEEISGIDLRTGWTDALFRLEEHVRSALIDARDGYDAACEALTWSAATVTLGIWWWPAAVAGLVMWFVSWRWLRRAADLLGTTAESAARRLRDTRAVSRSAAQRIARRSR